jgi:hypothetical protein
MWRTRHSPNALPCSQIFLNISNQALPESRVIKRERLQFDHLALLGARPGTPL